MTVDADLMIAARSSLPGSTDSSVVERALRSLLADLRAAEVDQRYRLGYDEHPFEEPDEWGSPAGLLDRAARS